MYAGGIPVGILIDHKGPRWGLLLGAILLAAGYYPIKLGSQRRSRGTGRSADLFKHMTQELGTTQLQPYVSSQCVQEWAAVLPLGPL